MFNGPSYFFHKTFFIMLKQKVFSGPILLALLFVLLAQGAWAQAVQTADVALAGGQGFSSAFSYSRLYGKKFKFGFGLRLTSYFGGATDALTAPAKLTSGKESLAALFSESIASQIDTLRLGNLQTNALNVNLHLQYSVTPKFELGFSIDAIGLTFGGEQSGRFTARQSDATGLANNGVMFSAKPTSFNLLLISDSDLGSLNSELYARYWLNDHWGLRAGISFQFIEYKASRKLAFDNDRFRSKVLLPMLAVSYKF
jgi:hypothetical protein